MKINFVEDRTNGYLIYFAISQLEVWRGRFYDELMWAEIVQGLPIIQASIPPKTTFQPTNGNGGIFRVNWEDNFYDPLYFDTLEEAKNHILQNFSKHTPYINGGDYEPPE